MSKSKSTWGGMFQKQDIKFEKRPHILTAEDAQMIMTFFDIIALGKFKMTLELFKPLTGQSELQMLE